MALDPRNIIDSPLGLNFAYALGKFTPERLGNRIAIYIADRISSRKSWKMVRATRCNQWVVRGEQLDGQNLDKVVAENYRSIASSIFELYHNLDDSIASLRLVEPHPTAIQIIQRPEFADRGLVFAGVHMSNFDLIFQMAGLASVSAIALSLPKMNAGYEMQREIRQRQGTRVLQTTIGTLKYAVDYLRKGGMVITGIDRPDQSYPYRPLFFNRPAALPTHHVFLALKAHVPIIVVTALKFPDGKYHFLFSDPLEMQPRPDRLEEMMINTEAVLRVAEGFIRTDPTQWSMTFPVWQEAMDVMPA